MGLAIRSVNPYGTAKHETYGSYFRIHTLRMWVLEHVEGNTAEAVEAYYCQKRECEIEKCEALLWHSDCDGGYISASHYGIKEFSNPVQWNDLDKLKQELQMLKDQFQSQMDETVSKCLQDLCDLIFTPIDDCAVTIVVFC